MPALLNAVGKLEVMAGNFDEAEKDFREVGTMVADGPAKAEAAYNAYRASLERRAWGEALGFLREAVAQDAARFAPFPPDKYEAEKILGAGGFGVAILCRNRHSGGKVVIKTLRRDGLDRDLGEVFREAQALEELEHPAIIRIRDCDYADEARARPYFVMDYFAGRSLADHVGQYGTLEPGQVVALAKLLASALQRAHSLGILHRDVKPGNVLVRPVGENWEAKLIDFGLALRPAEGAGTAKASNDHTLASASIAGTLGYAAPEQMGRLQGVAVGPYSDVYGFGKTCCFALFGTPQPTFQHWKALPPHLAELLGRCLDERPAARPQDFAEVLRELDKGGELVLILEALPAEATPLRPALRPRVNRERDRDVPPKKGPSGGMAVVAVVCALLLVVGVALLSLVSKRSPDVMPPQRMPSPVEAKAKGILLPLSNPWLPDLAKLEEIGPAEFPAIVAELKAKPDLPRLRTIAGRLAKTTPTEKQHEKHTAYEQGRGIPEKDGGPTKDALDRLRQADDITQVSLALEPLLEKDDLENHWYGAKACQKWGTEANVKALVTVAETDKLGGDAVRSAASQALAAIRERHPMKP